MNDDRTASIELAEALPHSPEKLWKVLTTGELISRWMGLKPIGFEPLEGNQFTYKTDPAGEWDGTIHCTVLEAVPHRRLVYSWKGGHAENTGYGTLLDTVVTFELSPTNTGTLLKITHSGFKVPRNDTAYRNMSAGWNECAENLQSFGKEN